jgi:Trypsin
MKIYVLSLAVLTSLSCNARAQSDSEESYASTLSKRLENLSGLIDGQAQVLNSNVRLLRASPGNSAFVFHGISDRSQASVTDGLLKSQHIDLWQKNATDFQAASKQLKDASDQIKGMTPATAIQTLNSILAPDSLVRLFSVTSDGRLLPDPPHQAKPTSIGGYVVGPGSAATIDYPSVAEIAYNYEGGFSTRCTGTLISDKAILTAAHCFCDFIPASTYAKCIKGTYKRNAETLSATDTKYVSAFFQGIGAVKVNTIDINPDFNFPLADLAILELSEPVAQIEPAPINAGPALGKGAISFIVGYGVHGAVNAAGQTKPVGIAPIDGTQGIKMWATVELGNCNAADRKKNLICWTYSPSVGSQALGSTCHGDSGGPMFANVNGHWSLIGVTSGGRTDCASSNKPADESYDVDVSKYRSWIGSKTQIVSSSADDKYIKDAANRAFGSSYHLFVETADKWGADFVVPHGQKGLTFAINATPTFSFLQIDLMAPGTDGPKCSNRTNDAFVSCSIDAPDEGNWRFTVSGSRPQESQALGYVRN